MTDRTSDSPTPEGWGFPLNSRKAHYFVETMSLCHKMGFYRGELEQGNDNSPDNCAECKRRLKTQQLKREVSNG